MGRKQKSSSHFQSCVNKKQNLINNNLATSVAHAHNIYARSIHKVLLLSASSYYCTTHVVYGAKVVCGFAYDGYSAVAATYSYVVVGNSVHRRRRRRCVANGITYNNVRYR